MDFATLDIVIACVVLLSALIGLVRGFVKEVLSLASWGLAFFLAIYLSPQVADQLPETWGAESVRMIIGFALVFVVTLIAAGVLQWVLSKLVTSTGLSGTDRLLGLVFGSARGLLVSLVMLMGLQQVAAETTWWQESVLQPELLAFEDDVRDMFGQARTLLDETTQGVDLPGLGG